MTIAPDQVARVVTAPSALVAARLVPFRPQVQRHILHDAQELSNPELADVLGCSLATAKIRMHRARTRLRESLAAACRFEIDERGVLVCDPQPDRRTEEGS